MLQERNPSDLYECPLCEEKVPEKDKSFHEDLECKALYENADIPVYSLEKEICSDNRTSKREKNATETFINYSKNSRSICAYCLTELQPFISKTLHMRFCKVYKQMIDTKRKSSEKGEKCKYVPLSELEIPKFRKCTYCKRTFKDDMLLLHEQRCVHQPVKCPGCSATVLLKDVEDHHCKSVKGNDKGSGERKNQKESKMLQEGNPSDLYECPLCKEKLLEKDKSIHESFYCEALFENGQESIFATLIQDFKKVLLDGQDHNLIFNVREKEIKAHRDILRARSEVFRSMLNHDMVENTSGVVNVPDCDPEAFEQLLLYIYSGKVEKLDENNMFELYYAADKYSLAPLKQLCGTFIKRSLSVTNVCEVIKLAMKHSDEGLRSEAVDYFMNNASDILPTVEWQTFLKENSTVANELIIKAFNKVKITQSS